jgi:hypothetical protein
MGHAKIHHFHAPRVLLCLQITAANRMHESKRGLWINLSLSSFGTNRTRSLAQHSPGAYERFFARSRQQMVLVAIEHIPAGAEIRIDYEDGSPGVLNLRHAPCRNTEV